MFSEIDKTIFTNSCEVLEIVPSQHYVFPIFKCGSSSLHDTAPIKNWKAIVDEDIKNITAPITVFLRDPKKRFISGVNTYLIQTKRQFPLLDENTILWFVDNYLFLNRHYCPQFFWLLNLSKYTNPEVKLQLCSYKNIAELTDINSDAGIPKPTDKFLEQIQQFNWKSLELYFFLDQILTDRIGQEFTVRELVDIVYREYPEVYRLVFEPTIKLSKNVLPST